MKEAHIIIIHLVFWFIVLSLNFSFLIFGNSDVPIENYLAVASKSIIEFINFYLFYFLIAPRLLKKKHYLGFFSLTIIYTLSYIPIYAFLLSYIYILLNLTSSWDIFNSQLIVATYYTIIYVILGGLLRLALDGFISFQQKIQLEKQNIKNELALLRTQINPHFLFNTLNTIHSYIISKNPASAEAVIKLSDIMRYMLYDAGKEEITLEQELDYLRSYIGLQNYRLEREKLVEFNISGNPGGIIIPPMILTPFVENAFKHGKLGDDHSEINIDLKISSEYLTFEISNYLRPVTKITTEKSEGVGLQNVKRRLELLYPGKHSLKISDDNIMFKVSLKISIR